ncbi:MAG: DUF3131 domain-containing protein [Candidatus Omnitrophica bacterium]|nr:DUF3131 domain-containing protein [Candidatus Omnitrophota bacterium]
MVRSKIPKLFRPLSFFLMVAVSVFSTTSCASVGPKILIKPLTMVGPLPGMVLNQIVRPEQSLLSASQFKVIDDFNGGELKNRMGYAWKTECPRADALRLVIEKKDARNQKRGQSLTVRYHLRPQEHASVMSELDSLDMSRAQYLVFKCRLLTDLAPTFTGRIRLVLSDKNNQSVISDVTRWCPVNQKDWGDIFLPMAAFRRLDLNRLGSIAFTIHAGKDESKGDFAIDEIAFYADCDIEHESLLDNLVGFPSQVSNTMRDTRLYQEKDVKLFLKEIAQDTWKYFVYARDKQTHLVMDHIRVGPTPLIGAYTSPTNIAMDFMGTVAAFDLGFISRAEAVRKLQDTLQTLRQLERWKGFFYNFYHTGTLVATQRFVSSVDNGWLAIALVIIRQAFLAELGKDATKLLDEFHFDEFLDYANNQLSIGYDAEKGEMVGVHYGFLVTEARATSYLAIGKGDVPEDHWWFIFRTTPPGVWKWQNQNPQGRYVTAGNVEYFQGYYTYQNRKFVPSWGGSLFEVLMPTLILKEKELAGKGLGLNNRISTELHRDYCLKENKYPVWGISPAGSSSGMEYRYLSLGIKSLGIKGYTDMQIITPHVSFLALDTLPMQAIDNIRRFLKFDSYGEYGFYDSVNVRTKKVNAQYLALDQGMSLIAICNYLKNGSIKERFHADPIGKKPEHLLKGESFFNP